MMQTILYVIFVWGFGYVLGKSFYGLNPFKMILGGLVAGLPAFMMLKEFNSIFYNIIFAIGALSVFGNPFGFFVAFYDGMQTEILLYKAQKRADSRERQQQEQYQRGRGQQEQEQERYQRDREQQDRNNRKSQEEQVRQEKEESQGNNKKKTSTKHDTRTAYQILGVSEGVSLAELKKAKQRLVSQLHEDKWKHLDQSVIDTMSEELKKVLKAFDELKNICK
jgi:hypothetical protein